MRLPLLYASTINEMPLQSSSISSTLINMKDICNVTLSPQALKDLKKVPLHIAIKLQAWIDDVGHRGLMAARKIPGYHDEPLKGKRPSQRSIRLSRAYRGIYNIDEHQNIQCVEIVEVNKHDY